MIKATAPGARRQVIQSSFAGIRSSRMRAEVTALRKLVQMLQHNGVVEQEAPVAQTAIEDLVNECIVPRACVDLVIFAALPQPIFGARAVTIMGDHSFSSRSVSATPCAARERAESASS
jgi:hypothetical protein